MCLNFNLYRLFIFLSVLFYIGGINASSSQLPFTVTYESGATNGSGQPTLLNMVPNSTQQLRFEITSNVKASPIIKCSVVEKSTTKGSYSVSTLGGCENQNGAGLPYPLVFTITSGTTPGIVNLELIIQDLSGLNKKKVNLNFNVLQDSQRTITFENYCPFTVWFGVASGTLPTIGGGNCTGASDCPDGTTCSSGQCFWTPPTPNSGSGKDTYKLAAYTSGQPATNSITIKDYSATNAQYANGKLWSGGFFGRTGCSFNASTPSQITCKTADCGDGGLGNGSCLMGQGASAPSTQVEPTFLVKTPDSYDVTIINGVNIPMSFTPDVPQGTSSPYDCGAPGGTSNVQYKDVLYSTTSPAPTGTLGGCLWSFTPPNIRYQWVSDPASLPGTDECTTDKYCTDHTSYSNCGLSAMSVNASESILTCGDLYGFWTDDEICVANSSFNASNFLNCTDPNVITPCTAGTSGCPFGVTAGTYNLTNLLACTTAPPDTADNKKTFASCFVKTGEVSSLNCCGCVNWQDEAGLSGLIPSDPKLVPQCGTNTATSNQYWTSAVLPGLIWLKSSCPSAYTYPYDDKTSGFSCPYAYETGQSAVNYTVTFCPDGKTGGVTNLG